MPVSAATSANRTVRIMKTIDRVDNDEVTLREPSDSDQLSPLLDRQWLPRSAGDAGVVVGKLLAITEQGCAPLVSYSGQASAAAVLARTVVDLHGAHVGRQVVLMFEEGDPAKPIVVGVVRGSTGWPCQTRPDQVHVDADGSRLTVTARQELVLQCGEASIKLTADGEVTIKGTRLYSHSSGVNRIKGGSVELN
jgi:hypothetical protein